MSASDRDMRRITRPELAARHLAAIVLEVEQQPPALDEDRFVLDLVVLEREATTRLDDERLAAEPVGQGPDQLVAPWLVDAPRCEGAWLAAVDGLGHEPRTRRSPATSIASRSSAEVASV